MCERAVDVVHSSEKRRYANAGNGAHQTKIKKKEKLKKKVQFYPVLQLHGSW